MPCIRYDGCQNKAHRAFYQNTSSLPLKNLINVSFFNHPICGFNQAFSISLAMQSIIKNRLKFPVTETNKKSLKKDKKNTLTKARDCNNWSTTYLNPDTATNQTRLGFLKMKACIYNFFSHVVNKVKRIFNIIKQKWLSQSQREAHFTDMATATISRQDIKTVNHQSKAESEELPVVKTKTLPLITEEAAPLVETETLTPITEEAPPLVTTDTSPLITKEASPVVKTETPPLITEEASPVVETETLTPITKEDRLVFLESKAYIYMPFLSRDMIAQAVAINLRRVLMGKEPHEVVYSDSIKESEIKEMLKFTKKQMIKYNSPENLVLKYKNQLNKENIDDFNKQNPEKTRIIGEYLALSKMTFIPMDQADKKFEKIYVLGHGTPANPNITSKGNILSASETKHIKDIAPELNQLIEKQRTKDPNLKIYVHIIACDGANTKPLDSFDKQEKQVIGSAKKPLGRHLKDALDKADKKNAENVIVVAYKGKGIRRRDGCLHKMRKDESSVYREAKFCRINFEACKSITAEPVKY